MAALIDPAEVFDQLVRRDASFAEADAVRAEIEAAHWQTMAAIYRNHEAGPDVGALAAKAAVVAAVRRRRADGIRGRLDDKPTAVEVRDMRPDVANRLRDLEMNQVMLEEMAAHTDLYAITDEEDGLPGDPNTPTRPSAEQIAYDTDKGRALIQAHRAWLDAHSDGPDLSAEPRDETLLPGIRAARRYYGIAEAVPTPAPEAQADSDG